MKLDGTFGWLPSVLRKSVKLKKMQVCPLFINSTDICCELNSVPASLQFNAVAPSFLQHRRENECKSLWFLQSTSVILV